MFFQDNFSRGLFVDTFGESGTQLNFSQGDIGGSALLTSVPEPSATILAGTAALMISIRRRRLS